MHKLLSFTALLISFQTVLLGQTVNKYPLIEHFTNTKCSVCASRNPAFFSLLSQYEADVHHISIHPSVPYNTCAFYLHNTVENNARATYYGVFGTPTLRLNGAALPATAQLLPASTLATALELTSTVNVQVTETADQVNVTVQTIGEKPSGSYVLVTAFVEKEINYNAPNGETLHHNVFRKMLTAANGDPITLAETGGSVSVQFAKPTNSSWNADQMYALAWVQNTQDKSVLNSGTRFDPVVTGTEEAAINALKIAPNPVQDQLFTSLEGDEKPELVEVVSVGGQLVKAAYSIVGQGIQVQVDGLAPGIYFLRVRGENGTFTGKFIKN